MINEATQTHWSDENTNQNEADNGRDAKPREGRDDDAGCAENDEQIANAFGL